MKTKNLVMFLFISVFLLAACLSSYGKQSLQTDISDQNEWQTYSSTKYQFTVRFPTTWQVIESPTTEFPTAMDQIWFVSEGLPPLQTDARADIALIFTREDPSLHWEARYFDDYQSNPFQLGDIEARRISGINKESKTPELVVLARIGDYYFQALPNHGEASLEYFDPVISSIRFLRQEDTTPAPLNTSALKDPDEKTIVFGGISFLYPSSLMGEATGEKIPAYVDPSGFMYDDLPEHVRFDFSNSYMARESFAGLQPVWVSHQNPVSAEIQPQIFIFPTEEYTETSPLAGKRIDALKNLLDRNTLPGGEELPVLPTFNSAQDLRGQVTRLEFQGGRGLRFIARYSQGAAPVVNPDLFYTFQGLTEDGSLYVAAFFPLYVPLLPDEIQVEDLDAFNQGYQDYMVDLTAQLERLETDDFVPDLASLDALIRSLIIFDET
jgi:hypothetical protein